MSNKKLIATAAVSAALFGFSVNAQPVESTADIENAFSQCGIGAAIFKKNETAAIISNIIWDLGTTALSSQSSSPDSCSGANTTAAAFIYDTYPSLEEDVVKGGGAHLVALMEIVGCNGAAHSKVIGNMQNDYVASIKNGVETRLEKSKLMGASLDRASTLCSA